MAITRLDIDGFEEVEKTAEAKQREENHLKNCAQVERGVALEKQILKIVMDAKAGKNASRAALNAALEHIGALPWQLNEY